MTTLLETRAEALAATHGDHSRSQVPSSASSVSCSVTGEERVEIDWEPLLDLARREARRHEADPNRAEDIAAAVVKRIWSRISELKPANLEAYVRRSVLNEVRSQWRRDRTPGGGPRVTALPTDDEVAAKRGRHMPPWMTSSPSTKAIRHQRNEHAVEVLAKVLEGLSERQLTLLRMAGDESMSYEQIAEELGYANADTVKATVSRLRKKLREQFGPDFDELMREW